MGSCGRKETCPRASASGSGTVGRCCTKTEHISRYPLKCFHVFHVFSENLFNVVMQHRGVFWLHQAPSAEENVPRDLPSRPKPFQHPSKGLSSPIRPDCNNHSKWSKMVYLVLDFTTTVAERHRESVSGSRVRVGGSKTFETSKKACMSVEKTESEH